MLTVIPMLFKIKKTPRLVQWELSSELKSSNFFSDLTKAKCKLERGDGEDAQIFFRNKVSIKISHFLFNRLVNSLSIDYYASKRNDKQISEYKEWASVERSPRKDYIMAYYLFMAEKYEDALK